MPKAYDPEQIKKIYDSYRSGKMDELYERNYEKLVGEGKLQMPEGGTLIPLIDEGIYEAYQNGELSPEESQALLNDFTSREFKLPDGVQLKRPDDLGFFGNIREIITGTHRKTEETKALPDWNLMPEIDVHTPAGLKTVLGSLATVPDEIIKIIRYQFPGVKIRQDDNGTYIMTSAIDKKEYVITPGLTQSDLLRAIFTGIIHTPAGRTGSLAKQVLGGMATQAALEGSQALVGGDFDAEEIGAVGAGAGIAYGVGKGFGYAKRTYQRFSNTVKFVQMDEKSLVGLMKKAINGNHNALKELALQVGADKKAIKAAKDMGILEFLPSQWVSTNQSWRELAQAISSATASSSHKAEMESLKQVGKRVNQIIFDMGATPDKGALSASVKTELQAAATKFKGFADESFNKVNTAFPLNSPAEATNTIKYLKNKASELVRQGETGGEAFLTPMQRRLLKDLSTDIDAAGLDYPSKYIEVWHGGRSSPIVNRKQPTFFSDKDHAMAFARNDPAKLQSVLIKMENPAPDAVVKEAIDELGMKSLVERVKIPKGEPSKAHYGLDFDYNYQPKEKVDALIKNLKKQGYDGYVTQEYNDMTKQFHQIDIPFNDFINSKFKGGPTYKRIEAIRKRLTQARVNHKGEFKDEAFRDLIELEKVIMSDQKAAIELLGDAELLKTFNVAQKSSAMYLGIQDDLTALFGKSLDGSITNKLRSATNKLAQGDETKFIELLKKVPENMRAEVTASGLLTAFKKNAYSGDLDFATFAKWYEGLLSNKKSYTALMVNLPKGSAPKLKNIYRIAKHIQQASRETLKTGKIREFGEIMRGADSFMNNFYSLIRQSTPAMATEFAARTLGLPTGFGIVAGLAAAFTRGKGTPIMEAADKLLLSPALTRFVMEGNETAAKRFALSRAWRTFTRMLGTKRQLSNPEQWILNAYKTTENISQDKKGIKK